jgi:hypothetical protein
MRPTAAGKLAKKRSNSCEKRLRRMSRRIRRMSRRIRRRRRRRRKGKTGCEERRERERVIASCKREQTSKRVRLRWYAV